MCLDTLGAQTHGSTPGLYACHDQGGNQNWMLDGKSNIKNDKFCLCVNTDFTSVILNSCKSVKQCQWKVEHDTITLISNGLCLTVK